MTETKGKNMGIQFTGLLTILFIGLKLTNYIDWSWWWVLSPFWIPLILAILVFVIGNAIIIACEVLK